MTRLPAVIAILLSSALLPQFVLMRAYAGGPIHNADHALGQFGMLLFMPLGIAIVVLGLWAMRARHTQQKMLDRTKY